MTAEDPKSKFFDRPQISVVLPIFDEQENIPELYRRLDSATADGSFEHDAVEFIFVDDGSKDGSADLIAELRTGDDRVKLVRLSRNFGHQAAITAGMDLSEGNAVILMDADLQDPPEVLAEMVTAWKNGAEVVYAVRQNRKESAFRRLTYFSFYRILQRISNIDIPLDSGDFCLMDRKVVDQLKKLPERNRFLRGLRSWVGFNQVALPYERQARFSGKAKYSFGALMKLALNGIFSFSSFPLRLATYLGFLVFVVGFIFLLVVVAAYFISGEYPQGWASLIVVMLFLGGVQLLILGAIGEYVAMIHDEVKERPNYVIREILD